MSAGLLAIISVIVVSLVSLIGLLTISVDEARLRAMANVFISFAAGALLGDAFIHLIPEIFRERSVPSSTLGSSLLILLGVMIFFCVEKLLRHQHSPIHEHHHPGQPVSRPELAAINILGDAVHNFIDGVLIGASYLVSPTLGLSTAFAVLLHEIPQEFSDFGILIHSGLSVRKAVMVNVASASIAIIGTGIALFAGDAAGETIPAFLLPITAGGFVYLAAANLIPELQHDRSLKGLLVQTGLISAGITLMALLAFVE